jgi:hypothetical protein
LKSKLPSKSAAISKRFCKHGDAMFRFLFDSAVPPTNNAAEQTFRQAIIDRRITQGSRSLIKRSECLLFPKSYSIALTSSQLKGLNGY